MGAPTSQEQADLAAAYQELAEAELQASVSKQHSFVMLLILINGLLFVETEI